MLEPFALFLCLLAIFFQQAISGDFGPAFTSNIHTRTQVRPELFWNWGHHFSRVSVENQRLPNVIGNALGYNFTLPRVQLQRGVAYAGSACRLRRVVRDLLTHRSIKVGVIGGSVSWGEGTSNRGRTDWFSVFTSYLLQAFPKSNVTGRNGCTPGVQSVYMVMCMDLSVDPDVDLIFVEYTLNDGHDERLYDNRVVKSMERLIRRLLVLPKRPAVVLMHNPTHFQTAYPKGHPKHGGGFSPFYFTSEDAQGALSQYYDVQSLSLRTALYRLAAFKELEGFRWEQLMADHHPGDSGHKCMADLAVYLLQETALGLLLHPFGAADEEVIEEPLPRPMYEGNLPPDAPMCIMYEQFKALVLEAKGFDYINEGTAVKPKPGYVATQPGSTLKLKLNTDRSATGNAADAVHVFFHHLRSYEHMGVAMFRCVSGCACSDTKVDAHITRLESQLYLAELVVSQSPECQVEITVLPETRSGEHKFKVAGVVVSDLPGRPVGMYTLGGDNQPFGLRQHTGDSGQITINSGGVFGVKDRRHASHRRLRAHTHPHAHHQHGHPHYRHERPGSMDGDPHWSHQYPYSHARHHRHLRSQQQHRRQHRQPEQHWNGVPWRHRRGT